MEKVEDSCITRARRVLVILEDSQIQVAFIYPRMTFSDLVFRVSATSSIA